MVPTYQAVVVAQTSVSFRCYFSRFLESSDLRVIKDHYNLLPGFKFYFRLDENVITVFINKGYTINDVLQDFKALLNSLGFEKISWEVWSWDKKGRELISSPKSEILEEVLELK